MPFITRLLSAVGVVAVLTVFGIMIFAPNKEHASGDKPDDSFAVPKSPVKGKPQVITTAPSNRPPSITERPPAAKKKQGSVAAGDRMDSSARQLVHRAAQLFAAHPSPQGKSHLIAALDPLLTKNGLNKVRRGWAGPDIGVGKHYTARARVLSTQVLLEAEQISPQSMVATAFVQVKMTFPSTPSTTTLRQLSATLIRVNHAWVIDEIAFSNAANAKVGT